MKICTAVTSGASSQKSFEMRFEAKLEEHSLNGVKAESPHFSIVLKTTRKRSFSVLEINRHGC